MGTIESVLTFQQKMQIPEKYYFRYRKVLQADCPKAHSSLLVEL